MTVRRFAFILPLMLAGFGALPAMAAGAECAAGERPVYACPFGKSVVSVCATDHTVTYRHGANGKTDLTITSSGADGRAHAGMLVGGGSGGQQASLRFSSAGHDYIVYSATSGALTDAPGRSWSGLAVMQGDRQVSSRECPVNGKAQRMSLDGVSAFVSDEDNPSFEMWF
jgi:hypothetical protein